jgi:hypothetical protein
MERDEQNGSQALQSTHFNIICDPSILLLNFVFARNAPLTIFLSQNRSNPPAASRRGGYSAMTD